LGLTDKILKKIQKKKGQAVTTLYNDIQTMENFKFSPAEFVKLHRWDRLLLRYYTILKNYYEEEAAEKAKEEADRERDLLSKMPAQREPHGR